MSMEKQLRPDLEYDHHRELPAAAYDRAGDADEEVGAIARDSVIQRRELGGGLPEADVVHAAAARGVASPTTAMPHADRIQASFGGAHDVSQIEAHVGGDSAAAMGAAAFATGNHVVFDKPPDLHTAAHEAAHVVQQAGGVNVYGGVGQAGDRYEQEADAIADRVVAGESAADLLGGPAHARAREGTVQAKAAPSQAYGDQLVIGAIQAHMKLTAARMHAGGAQITNLLKSDTSGPAGHAVMMADIAAQIALVNNDLDALKGQIARVPQLMAGALTDELGALHGAFHESWAPAVNRVYSFTRDDKGNVKDFAVGLDLSLTPSQVKIREIFKIAGVDQQQIKAVLAPRLKSADGLLEQRDDELKEAELEALKSGMASVETSLALVKADLHGSAPDLGKQALGLTVSVEQLVAVFEPIAPEHIGKISKLPVLIKEVEALQAEVMNLKHAGHDKGTARTLGHETQLSRNLYRLKTKIKTIDSTRKPARR